MSSETSICLTRMVRRFATETTVADVLQCSRHRQMQITEWWGACRAIVGPCGDAFNPVHDWRLAIHALGSLAHLYAGRRHTWLSTHDFAAGPRLYSYADIRAVLDLSACAHLRVFDRWEIREAAGVAYLISQLGDFASYPETARPACSDCFSAWKYCHKDGDSSWCPDPARADTDFIALQALPAASTFYDTSEARYYLCERCWRMRMRGSGHTEGEIRRVMVELGGFTVAEAVAVLKQDAAERQLQHRQQERTAAA